MKAIAATEDRQEFNRLTSPPTKSQQTPRLRRANHENWRVLRSAVDSEGGSPTGGIRPARRSTRAQDDVFTATPVPATPERPSDPKSHRLASSSTGVAAGASFGNSPKDLSPQRQAGSERARAAPSDRNVVTPEEVLLKAANQVVSGPPNQEHAAQDTLVAKGTVATPTVSAENGSNTQIGSTEQGSRVEHQPTTSDVDTYQPVSSSQKAGAAQGNARRYDIVTLKRWQPANGGTGLPIAQKAVLRMRSLLSLQAQPPFDRPAINVEHANHFMKSFLDQAQKADHQDVCNHTKIRKPVNSCLVPSYQTEPVEANATKGFEEENEITLDVAEADGKKHDTWVEGNCAEEDAAEESSEAIVDCFKWLLPANFR
jgi:hypothetical protein